MRELSHKGNKPRRTGEKMLKDCDECGKQFNIFLGGMGNQFFTACGECWAIELKRREIGGVFTR
jgi:predicted nucleic acid-binding Zn ribbon protein